MVCLAQPYPPNYGGAVDMFYKLKELHNAGIDITLHVFLYGKNKKSEELTRFASKVFYYKRYTGLISQLGIKPYIVKSRQNQKLLRNLCVDDSPILFEGIHTCAFLGHPLLRNRYKIVRMHNIEHEFYRKLASYHPFSWRALFFKIEAWKLERYEKILECANKILAISSADVAQLQERYPNNEIKLLNCFFDNTAVSGVTETNPFLLYHGNLSVAENIHVVEYLISEIAPNVKCELVIAGLNPSEGLRKRASAVSNVKLVANPSEKQMCELIASAQINILITFQHTGVKLKLLNALYKGNGHIIANGDMLYGTKVDTLCVRADKTSEILQAINRLMTEKMPKEQVLLRREKISNLGYNRIDEIVEIR